MEDDDILEFDSPLEQAVDIEDDEIDELLLDGRAGSSAPTTSLSRLGTPGAGKPIHYPSKIEERASMMHYADSLPYQCESLEEFDARMDLICRRLVECVQAKE